MKIFKKQMIEVDAIETSTFVYLFPSFGNSNYREVEPITVMKVEK